MTHEVAIDATTLGKTYRLGRGRVQHNTLRDLISDAVSSVTRRAASPDDGAFWALRDVSFKIQTGENVGIIGLNGAGKSTLLKILSRITVPTLGSVRISGRVGALLEVGTGFHAELTGRENVFLYGAILGMTKAEIRRKFDAIVDFSETAKFIDTPVKRYSSGMYVRLAFAVAAHLEPEILLLDEVLAVGDLPFQKKCMEFAKRLQRANATILFVSHNMFSIKTMCERVIYLRKGRVQFDGPTEEGIALYEDESQLTADESIGDSSKWPIMVTSFTLMDETGRQRAVFDYSERLCIRIGYTAREPLINPNFVLMFKRSDGVACCDFSSELDHFMPGTLNGDGVIEARTSPLRLVADSYLIKIIIWSSGFQTVLCEQVGTSFHVRHELVDRNFGVTLETAEWTSSRS